MKVRLIYVHRIRYLFCKNSIYRSIGRNKFVNGQIKTENQQKKTEWDHRESKLGWIQFNLFLNPWHGMTFLIFSQYIQSSINGGPHPHPRWRGMEAETRAGHCLSLHPHIHISSVWIESCIFFTVGQNWEFNSQVFLKAVVQNNGPIMPSMRVRV